MSPETGVILAATEGRRLRPLTSVFPKPLIPIEGKPLIFHSIELFEQLDVKKVVVTIEPRLGSMIKKNIERKYLGNMNFDFVVQKEHSGVGFAILECNEKVGDSPFFVRYADEYHPLTKTLKPSDFQDNETVLVVRREEVPKYLNQNTNVNVDEVSGKVTRVGRPLDNKPFSEFHLCGLMSFPSSFFETLNEFKENPDSYTKSGEFSTLGSIQHLIDTENSVGYTECGGFYANINTYKDLMKVYQFAFSNQQ